jgi:uncharacterized protein (TIGR02687 family)
MKRIYDSLENVFTRHRLVFWYDPTGEWTDTFDAYSGQGVTKLKVLSNEFGIKVRIVRESNPEAKFLIHVPTARPADANNWLLDLLLQGYEYKADRASLVTQEVGLPTEFRHLAEEHASFFNSGKRTQAFRDLVGKDDGVRDLRLKMIAVLAGTPVEVEAMLLHFLGRAVGSEMLDPAAEALEAAALVGPFWREVARTFGYAPTTPYLRDFAVWLFRAANPLDSQVALHPHAKVFLQRWKDSQSHRDSYRQWAEQMERELQINVALGSQEDGLELGDCDTFETFERFILHRLCRSFTKGGDAAPLRAVIQQRRSSFWHSHHAPGYAALEQALDFREWLDAAELEVDSIANGVARYTARWWRIDQAYRLFTLNQRRYRQAQVMGDIVKWVEKAYVNNFLLPLADRWSDQVSRLDTWHCPGVPRQPDFFEAHVRPFPAKGQKVFVIVSDALRYEVAVDFAERLRSANRWTAEVEFMWGALPSYTQLGMASLLPGKDRHVDAVSGAVTVDGRSATGTPNRDEILHLDLAGRATAIQAEAFLEMNTKTDGRALMRDHEVIYIFHNVIDKIGDALTTETKTFEAVEQTFQELELIIKKIANINGTNMLLTADHGFLYQQESVAAEDAIPLPEATEWTNRNRRFALGRGIVPQPNIKVFTSQQLSVGGDWSAAFPLSLGRFPLQGSGMRYVHGGFSLQEVLVPVVKIHKARADDIGRVEVELLRVPPKITTGQLSLSLLQDRPALGKILPRTLRIGVFAKDGTILSDLKTLTFDFKDPEARNRETTVLLLLSHAADSFNNAEVEVRLEETVAGTSHIVTYKTHRLKLQKHFSSDFDEL